MKKILAVAVLSAFAATPTLSNAFEFDQKKLSVGASYGLGNSVLSARGDYDISDIAGHPVKARVGYDRYSIDTSGLANYTWSYNVFYAGAYYDFNKQLKLDSKIHPFAGLGFGFGSTSCSGGKYTVLGTTYDLCGSTSASAGGFYYIGGVQYDVTSNINAEVGFSGWTGLSLGANYKF